MPSIIDIFKAIISGAIEGLTEFIPVSSTAHLLIFSWLSDFDAIKNNLFEVFIQFGAVLAICVIYRRKLILTITKIKRQDSQNFIANLALSFIPAAIIGLSLHGFIKNVLFSPIFVGFALVIGGFIMILVDNRKITPKTTRVDQISKKQAFLIGCFQSIAVIPGVSRSGATIIGGLLLGMNRRVATEFSFFMSIIVISAASLYDLYKNYAALDASNIHLIIFGFISAFISALFVIKWFINYVSTHDFTAFAIYRIVFGSILLFFILI